MTEPLEPEEIFEGPLRSTEGDLAASPAAGHVRGTQVREPTQEELDALPVEKRLDLINQRRQHRYQSLNSIGILFGVVFTRPAWWRPGSRCAPVKKTCAPRGRTSAPPRKARSPIAIPRPSSSSVPPSAMSASAPSMPSSGSPPTRRATGPPSCSCPRPSPASTTLPRMPRVRPPSPTPTSRRRSRSSAARRAGAARLSTSTASVLRAFNSPVRGSLART